MNILFLVGSWSGGRSEFPVALYPSGVLPMRLILAVLLVAAPVPAFADEALFAAARKGDVAAVRERLAAGADVNAKTPYGASALSFASEKGHLDVVRELLKANADPNVKDNFYQATPMTWA